MVRDYLDVKNACLDMHIFDYGSRSISVSETKQPGKRIYDVWFVAYYIEAYETERSLCNRKNSRARSKAYYKEFLDFKKAEEAY